MVFNQVVANWQTFQRSRGRLLKLDHFRYATKIGHEVKYYDLVLSRTHSETAPELLHENPPAMRRAHEHDQVDVCHQRDRTDKLLLC